MTTTINNEHKKLNFSSEREQSQACLNSAEHEKNQGRKVLNVPNLRFPEFQGEWEKCKLGDYGKVVTGNTPPTKDIENYENGTYLWASPADLGIIKSITETKTMLSVKGFSKTRTLPKGSVLVTCIGSTIGKTGMATKEMSTNQQINSIVVNDNNDNEFVYYAIQSAFPRYLSSIAVQAVPIISKSAFELLPNKRPCLQEQKRIGKFLSLLDERISTQNKIIEDLKKLKSAISKKLLCNDKWATYKIQDIAEIGRGRVISSVEINRQKHPLYPVYSSQTSNNGIMGYLDNYMFDGEYITWTTDGANAGTVFYRKGKFNCTNVCGTLKIQPKFDCYFVSLVLQQATQKYVSSNLANPKLMNNTMASIKIKMPNIETQKQLSKVFQALDGCLSIHQRTCEMYLKEKQYLLRQMFI